jgi:CBS domain containing-hemolysin-like protein
LYLSTCQIGITVASLGLGYVTESTLVGMIEPVVSWTGLPYDSNVVSAAIGLVIATALHVVVGEVAPKNLAIYFPDRLLPILAPPLIALTYIAYPAIWVLNASSNALLRLVGVRVDHGTFGGLPHTAEELQTLLDASVQQGGIAKSSHHILKSAFGFDELKVRQIMTPRTDVNFMHVDQPLREVVRIMQRSEFTRFPLCERDLDHIVGLIHVKDLIGNLRVSAAPGVADRRSAPGGGEPALGQWLGASAFDLRRIRRDILFVPEMLAIPKLLRQFQNSRVHMAVVVDEYGATLGIVTLEDVIEELVGEILDEFDSTSGSDFVAEGESFRTTGLYPMHELRRRLHLSDVDSGDVDTLSGYIVRQLSRWPRPGDQCELGPYQVRVVSITKRRVGQVLITPTTQDAAKADGPGVA